MKTLVVVIGPTGVGKTATSIALARHYGTAVINADSRQMFRELPIGTAAPTADEQAGVKHYFVGNLSIEDYYSAAMYEADALKIISQQHETNNIALLSGGSMMYIDAVCKGIDDIPTIDDDTRHRIKQIYESEGLAPLLADLQKLDPEYYDIVDKQNTRRVIHALEICEMTGKTYTSFRVSEKKQRPFKIIKIGLNLPREQLYERINARVIAMVKAGLIEEAKSVYPQKGLNALNTVGYKEMFAYFDGEISLEEAIRQIQSNSRRYCRKQLTWYRRDEEVQWFTPTATDAIINYIDNNR